MKLVCTQENLSYGLQLVSHISLKNVRLPILNNILIEAKEGLIYLSATNLETGIVCKIRGKIDGEGAVTVHSRLISEFIYLLPKDKVELEVTTSTPELSEGGVNIKIRCQQYKTKILGLSAADFPVIPKFEKKTSTVCTIDDLRSALAGVIFAATASESRPEISGICLHFSRQQLTLAATDSFRLAEKKITCRRADGPDEQVIIPVKTLQELSRILSGFKESADPDEILDIEIAVSQNQIVFRTNAVEITSRLIDGQYPDYKQILPKRFASQLTLPTNELTKAVKSVSLFSRTGIHDIRLRCLCQSGQLVVDASNSQLGESEVTLAAVGEGDDNEIILNFRYLLEGLQNIETAELQLSANDKTSPCLIQPKDRDDYRYVIMPIKQ